MKTEKDLNYSSLLGEKSKKKIKRDYTFEAVRVPEGSRKKRKRIGRGTSSGTGKTSGKGQKGQKARSGYSRKAGFEGGQMPIHRRLPKRGFTNIFGKLFQVVNLHVIEKGEFSGEVTPEILKSKSLISDPTKPLKILGTGEIKGALKITADAFSDSARQKIEKAGGSCVTRKNLDLVKTYRPKFEKKQVAEKK
jgi:large subunit ribosomal protein L15